MGEYNDPRLAVISSDGSLFLKLLIGATPGRNGPYSTIMRLSRIAQSTKANQFVRRTDYSSRQGCSNRAAVDRD